MTAITTSRRDSRAVVCFSPATSRGGAGSKIIKGGLTI